MSISWACCPCPFTPMSQFSVINHMLISPAAEVKHFHLSATIVKMPQQKSYFSVSPAQEWYIFKWNNNMFGFSDYYLRADCFCFYFGSVLPLRSLHQLSTEALITGKPGAGDQRLELESCQVEAKSNKNILEYCWINIFGKGREIEFLLKNPTCYKTIYLVDIIPVFRGVFCRMKQMWPKQNKNQNKQ